MVYDTMTVLTLVTHNSLLKIIVNSLVVFTKGVSESRKVIRGT